MSICLYPSAVNGPLCCGFVCGYMRVCSVFCMAGCTALGTRKQWMKQSRFLNGGGHGAGKLCS